MIVHMFWRCKCREMNLTEDVRGKKNTNKSRNTGISWCVSVKNHLEQLKTNGTHITVDRNVLISRLSFVFWVSLPFILSK